MKTPLARTARIAGAMLALASLSISTTLRAPATPLATMKNPLNRGEVRPSLPTDDAANKMRVSEAYGKLPMSFEPNRVHTDRKGKYLSRGSGYTHLLPDSDTNL